MTHNITLIFDDGHEASISCRPDEDIITAALRQGMILMSECREGVCSTCKCYLVEGEYDELLPHSVYALSPNEEEDGYVLACRLQPRGDLELEHDYPFSMVQQFTETERRASIDQIEMVSSTVARVVIRTLGAQDPVEYVPGQFLRLSLTNGVSRDFSMANTPGARLLEFYIRVYPDGEFSSYIGSSAQVGEQVTLFGPRGKFILRNTDRVPVFIAGGTGLAPVLAMLRDLAATDPEKSALLVFGNTSLGDVFCSEELKELQKQMPGLTVHRCIANADPSWTEHVGRVTDVLERILVEPDEFDYYYCGPPAMIEATTRLLENLGVPREYRHHEDFVPSSKEQING